MARRSSEASQQRIQVEWQTLRLAEAPADGYAPTARPLADVLHEAVQKLGSPESPTVVWIFDKYDEKANGALESKVFCDEKVGLALKRFVCLKGDAREIPPGIVRRDVLRHLPAVYFFDPGGKLFCALEGKQAGSRSTFCARLGKLWIHSFTMTLRNYTKHMSKILDAMDKIEDRRRVLRAKAARAGDNPRKLAGVTRELRELETEEEKVLEKERKILAACAPRPKFKPSEETAAK